MSEHPLAKISLFEKLSPEELTKLESIVKRRMFKADTVVFFEGDQSDSMYVILNGSVKVYTKADDGSEKILTTLGKGEIFGEYSLIDGHPRSANIATLEGTEMLSISHKDFRQFVTNSPEILWKVLESLTERMRRTNAEQLQIAFRDVPFRLFKVLANLADKHGQTTSEGTRINLKLTVRDLAGMVSANPEQVKRILNRLQSEGLIRADQGFFLVPDLAAFKRGSEYQMEWS
jgi:CRP/FNR family transcriptional regulator